MTKVNSIMGAVKDEIRNDSYSIFVQNVVGGSGCIFVVPGSKFLYFSSLPEFLCFSSNNLSGLRHHLGSSITELTPFNYLVVGIE